MPIHGRNLDPPFDIVRASPSELGMLGATAPVPSIALAIVPSMSTAPGSINDRRSMKTLFIDCNPQFELVFKRVHRADDPAVVVNNDPFQSSDLPRLLDGYGICIDDHSYMPTEQIAQCKSLRHIVFCGTGAASYMDVAALKELGVTVHTYRGYGDTAVAEHTIALMWAAARGLAIMDGGMRRGEWFRTEGMQLTGKTIGLLGYGGIAAEVARIAAGWRAATGHARPEGVGSV